MVKYQDLLILYRDRDVHVECEQTSHRHCEEKIRIKEALIEQISKEFYRL